MSEIPETVSCLFEIDQKPWQQANYYRSEHTALNQDEFIAKALEFFLSSRIETEAHFSQHQQAQREGRQCD